ncbi:hypothetical protein BV20DRAFT_922327, partial [Pilatotrama ljubarskyi]
GLSFSERDALLSLDAGSEDVEENMDVDPEEWYTLPPGEEAMFVSHAGGEEELRVDGRTRRDHVLVRTREWDVQREDLVDTYLQWQAGIPPRSATSDDGREEQWELHVVDFFARGSRSFSNPWPSTRTNVTLALHGYMGTAPLQPSVAIGFKTLAAYRQLHRMCPRLSVQAQVRALCYLHGASDISLYIAFDMYLEILHQVDLRVHQALQRDTPNWRMLNACAPCLYRLEGEPELVPAILATMDGNQLLKLVDDKYRSGTTLTDTRTACTDLWLSPEEVDRFKDEVQA